MEKINWLTIKSALVSGLLMALVIVITEIVAGGDVFKIDWKILLNIGIISFLTSFVSFLKSLLTTDRGTIAGVKIR